MLDVGDTITNANDNEHSSKSRTIVLKSIVTMHGRWVIRESWSNDEACCNNLSSFAQWI